MRTSRRFLWHTETFLTFLRVLVSNTWNHRVERMVIREVRMLILLPCSPGTCRQVCLWPDRASKDARGASCWTSTVSNPITGQEKKAFGISSVGIDIHSFYEGHTMDAATFATRVCKLLGVETIIGAFDSMKAMSDLCSDHVCSHQCSWWFEPRLLSRRHRVPK